MWLLLILVVIIVIYFLSKTRTESSELNSNPFIHTYPIIVSGINEYLFGGEAEFESKDAREHYLIKKSLGKISYVQFIYRKNTLYLKYYENLMEIKTDFSFYYSNTNEINQEQQHFIAKDFSNRVKNNSKINF
ncbi:hypothetical protein UJ101_02032 [Flavobacteriaceae bacterium UJ101]|nr:hypothetical protein UJ101_02032 [Flavobacteriaceae bacterium UJ101]